MTAEQELVQFSQQWDKAMLTNDVLAISEFMSDDWIIVGTEGGITSKETFLETIRSGSVSHSTMDADEINTRIYGNMGIVTSRGTSAGKFNGKPFSLYEWSTSVCVNERGRWRCVHTMLTPAQTRKYKTFHQ
jgi:ketosteroid isomerase-like protein